MNPYLRLMRPHQWLKNVFVLVGLVFGFAWADPHTVRAVALVFASFCLMSSASYIYNDWRDIEQDRCHPKKRLRPLAAGEVKPIPALLLAAFLMCGALVLGWLAGWKAFMFLVAYLALTIFYSTSLKHIVLLDTFALAAGFFLRIMAGTAGVGIPPSKWLVLCSVMLALFLGFAKRRAEIISIENGNGNGEARQVLKQYNGELLGKYLSGTGMGTVIFYGLYTVDPSTVEKHSTEALVYTVPLVMYALFRYLFLLHKRDAGEDPSREFIGDPHILATGVIWFVSVALLIWHA